MAECPPRWSSVGRSVASLYTAWGGVSSGGRRTSYVGTNGPPGPGGPLCGLVGVAARAMRPCGRRSAWRDCAAHGSPGAALHHRLLPAKLLTQPVRGLTTLDGGAARGGAAAQRPAVLRRRARRQRKGAGARPAWHRAQRRRLRCSSSLRPPAGGCPLPCGSPPVCQAGVWWVRQSVPHESPVRGSGHLGGVRVHPAIEAGLTANALRAEDGTRVCRVVRVGIHVGQAGRRRHHCGAERKPCWNKPPWRCASPPSNRGGPHRQCGPRRGRDSGLPRGARWHPRRSGRASSAPLRCGTKALREQATLEVCESTQPSIQALPSVRCALAQHSRNKLRFVREASLAMPTGSRGSLIFSWCTGHFLPILLGDSQLRLFDLHHPSVGVASDCSACERAARMHAAPPIA